MTSNDWKPTENNISSPWDVNVQENNIGQPLDTDKWKFVIPDDALIVNQPKQSNWKCYMFGNRPDVNTGIMYIPAEGHVPNRFVRFMMRICFDCMWVEEK